MPNPNDVAEKDLKLNLPRVWIDESGERVHNKLFIQELMFVCHMNEL